jgi:hypothetical protein
VCEVDFVDFWEEAAMGREVDSHVFSREDRTRYREKVRLSLDVFTRMLAESSFDFERPMTGLEIELNLVDENADPALRNANVLEVMADPAFVTELGQFNIEINVPPRSLAGDGFARYEAQVRESLNAAEEHARSVGAHLAMIGILPTLRREQLTLDVLSANPRYGARTWRSSSTASSGCRPSATRSRPRRRAPASSSTCRSARRTSPDTGTRPRRSPRYRSRSAPTRRSCSARNYGARPASRCSSRRPTRGRRS